MSLFTDLTIVKFRHGRTSDRPANPEDKSCAFFDTEAGVLYIADDTMAWLAINASIPTLYYQTVQNEGTPETQRSALNFVGAGVSVSDAGGATVVTVAGSDDATILSLVGW